jgi:hypothetical protein
MRVVERVVVLQVLNDVLFSQCALFPHFVSGKLPLFPAASSLPRQHFTHLLLLS